MERFVWEDFPCTLRFEQVQARLLLEEAEDIALMRDRFAHAMRIARPKAVCRIAYVDAIEGDEVVLDGFHFQSRVLAQNLADIHRVFAYVVTCGREVDDWSHAETDVIVSLWLDMLKEMILGDAGAQFQARMQARFGLGQCARMNPGSGDVDVWPIAQQRPLFALIGDVEAATGARLTDSFLMLPTKSVSGILFPSETGFVTCALCSRARCTGRKVPFDPARMQAATGS